MKVLLDACVPRPLRQFLPGHAVHTAQELGWGKLKNGALLREAETQCDALLTSDQNLKYQQNLAGRNSPSSFCRRTTGRRFADGRTRLPPGWPVCSREISWTWIGIEAGY